MGFEVIDITIYQAIAYGIIAAVLFMGLMFFSVTMGIGVTILQGCRQVLMSEHKRAALQEAKEAISEHRRSSRRLDKAIRQVEKVEF